MAVYVVTGKLGGGKTLISVKRIKDRLEAGRVIATNLDLNLEKLISPFNKTARVIRIPDKPSILDLTIIGKGTESYDEDQNGLLVLDECGTWFNSRNWQDKARVPVNEWFLHARKLGWDVILIIQDVGNLDSQARSSIAEHTVFCKRTDRFAIPYISTWFKMFTGSRLVLPKAHVGRVVYGILPTDMLVDRWATRGTSLHSAYDTKQAFLDSYSSGPYSVLPPFYNFGRYMAERDWKFYMRVTKIFWKRFKSPIALGAGMLIGSSMAVAAVFATQYDPNVRELVYSVPVIPGETIDDIVYVDPVIEMLKTGRIVGSWSAGGDLGYSLSYSQGENEDGPIRKTIETNKLENMGYDIIADTGCSLVVSRLGQQVPVYCF